MLTSLLAISCPRPAFFSSTCRRQIDFRPFVQHPMSHRMPSLADVVAVACLAWFTLIPFVCLTGYLQMYGSLCLSAG